MSRFILSRVGLTALITLISLSVFQAVVERYYPGTSPWQADAATVLFATLMTTVASYLGLRQYEIMQQRTTQERESRLHMELALQRSDELFRLLVETMTEGLAVRDKEGRHTFVNQRFCELVGYTEGELLGEPALNLVDEENRAIVLAQWEKREQGSAEPYELTLTRKDSSKLFTLASPRAIYDEQGGFRGSFGVFTDITAQKQREAELLETKTLLEKTFSSLEEVVFVIDPETRTILACNQAVERVFGYPADELIGQTTFPLHIDRETFTRFVQEMNPALKEHGVFQTEYTMRHRSGRLILTEYTARTVWEREGKPAAVVSVVRDITARKQAEDALRRSEENNRALIETMAQGVIYLDKAGKITAANPGAERILGVPLSQMLGRTPQDPRWGVIHEDGTPFPGESLPSTVALETGREIRDVVMGISSPQEDGCRWIKVHAVPQFRPGERQPYQVHVTFEDITDLKRKEQALRASEERYRALFQLVPVSIFTKDRQGCYLSCNDTGQVYTQDSPVGKSDYDLQPREIADQLRANEIRVMESGKRMTFEERIMAPDGLRHLLAYKVPLQDENGEISGLLGATLDITKRKQAEQELEASQRRLQALIDNTLDAIMLADDSGCYVDANPAACHLTGYSRAELLERAIWDLTPGANEKSGRETWARFQAEGELSGGYELIRKDGRIVEVEYRAVANILPGLHLSLMRDITQQRHFEAELNRVMTSIPDALWSAQVSQNLQIDYRYYSPVIEKISGYPSDDFISGRVSWLNLIHSEDRPRMQQISQHAATGALLHLDEEYRIMRADGEIRWVRDSVEIREDEKQTLQLNGVISDVTERKQNERALRDSEERYRRLVEFSPDAITLISGDHIVFTNPAGLEQYGATEIEQLLAQPLEDLVHPEDWGRIASRIEDLEEGRPIPLTKTRGRRADGSYLPLEITAIPYTYQGDPAALLISRDISMREALEKAEQEQRALAEALRDTAAALNSTLDFDEVLDRILENVGRVVHHDAADILLLEDGAAHIVRSQGFEAFGLKSDHLSQVSMPLEQFASIRRVYESGQPNVIPDTRADPLWLDLPQFRWIRSLASAPIRQRGEVIGFLNLNSSQAGFFTTEHADRLQAFADQAAIAIGNARLYQSLQQQSGELARSNHLIEALNRMAARMQSSLEIEAMMATMSRELKAINLSWALAFYDPQTRSLNIRDSSIRAEMVRRIEKLIGLKRGELVVPQEQFPHFEWVKERGRAYYDENPDALAMAQAMLPMLPRVIVEQILKLSRVYSGEPVVYLPLAVGEGVIGVMWVWGPELRESDLPTFTIFATQVAAAIQNVRLFEDISAGRERMRDLTQRVFTIQEDERWRLSRELHDEAGQAMTALKIGLELVRSDLSAEQPELYRRMDEAIDLTENTMEQLRALAQDLRPPALDTVGLNATLEGYCQSFARRTKMTIEYRGAQEAGAGLPPEYDIALYRVLQEALNNAAKHAHVRRVQVSLEKIKESVILTVQDSGKGFNPKLEDNSQGLGILGMRERIELLGGELQIDSGSGKGTKLAARLPMNRPHVERRKADDPRRAR